MRPAKEDDDRCTVCMIYNVVRHNLNILGWQYHGKNTVESDDVSDGHEYNCTYTHVRGKSVQSDV